MRLPSLHIDDSNAHLMVGDGRAVSWNERIYYLSCRQEYAQPALKAERLKLKDVGIQVIPPSKWEEYISAQEQAKASLADLFAKYPPLDQDGTNYCWVNAVTHCVEIARVRAGLKWIRLSPASVGGPITGYRNVGGWPDAACKYAAEHGFVPAHFWPENAISSRYDTPETRAERAKYKIETYWLDPESPEECATLLLLGFPLVAALNWWSHAVTYLGVAKREGEYVWLALNSWGADYGDNGRFTLEWRKGTPDDATAIYSPRIAVWR